MKLRDELLPNASEERISKVLSKIKEIETHLNNTNKVSKLIDKLNEFSYRDYNKEYFQNFRKYEKIEDLARDIAQIPPKKTNITDDELTEVINRIRNNDINSHFYYQIIDVNINYGAASEIIDFPENQGLKNSEDIAHFIKYFR
ncbi:MULTISPECIES: hypothetical protein [Tenacibaculum]|uniref:hypothetical protein n=1 Tax=Tenacibaculum TaxID=104267 RepID=UPI001F0A0660|nr:MULTISPECIES: hypothetical protein [Tenacibaculum]MCH3882038.1 hypothetical protein [Tenacibaculum aquimarinum]MDO6599679.1 hypothetical protein [Tenacibaculum sp. 1_MG-2023]